MATRGKKNASVPDGAKTMKEKLPVLLTDLESSKKGKIAAKLQKEIDGIREQMNEVTSTSRQEIKDKTAQLRQALKDVESGTEDREVLCYEDRDFTKNVVRIIRTDTNVEVRNRTMDAAERQQELKPAKAAKKGGKKGGGNSVPDPVNDDGPEAGAEA